LPACCARAATQATRAVFLCSAPLVDLGQPNAGLSLPGVRLACAEPGDQLAIFGEALHELAERSAFLYEEAGRFWFSTHEISCISPQCGHLIFRVAFQAA
jgi:hypothetical protein